ncbi:GNAT family acetyltransferase [Pseudodesulfovibrio sp.]|uniref:GNAT family acetyltransferase n=1 Tax=unclassified Pseudodesulfovibrio TaxID=2661612 RepID=UPI003B00E189
MEILTYDDAKHREAVIALWKTVFGYTSAHNDPGRSIDRKLSCDDLFFVAIVEGAVAGTVMAGYDGHRGWIYTLAVRSDFRRNGIGTALLRHTENRLQKLGCDKINLQVVGGNDVALEFYEANDYLVEDRVSMGKRAQ